MQLIQEHFSTKEKKVLSVSCCREDLRLQPQIVYSSIGGVNDSRFLVIHVRDCTNGDIQVAVQATSLSV